MAFSTGQQVTASDLNAFSVTTVTTTGAVTTGGGVQFPAVQAASADANNLDDYEEGTWTPVIGGSGGTSGQAYSSQVGWYIKIGKLVVAGFSATLSTEGTITGSVEIQGLPFTVQNTTAFFGQGAVEFASLATNWISLIARATPNTTTAVIVGTQAAGANNQTTLSATDINDTSSFAGTVCFRATA